MKNIINFTGILTSLFLSLPGFAQYAPNFDVTFQTANNSNYNQVLASTGVSVPMWQNVNSTIFSDLRISSNNDDMYGSHLGLGVRRDIANTTIWTNGFYDI